MARLSLGIRLALVAPALLLAPTAQAGVGDLLVAPTRVVLNGSRGTEIILSNIGDDVATYRISAELRRMTPDGKLTDVELPSDKEKVAQEMILYAPRKVTLPPNQPQPAQAHVNITKPLTLEAEADLQFGSVAVYGPGTITIPADGSSPICGDTPGIVGVPVRGTPLGPPDALNQANSCSIAAWEPIGLAVPAGLIAGPV